MKNHTDIGVEQRRYDAGTQQAQQHTWHQQSVHISQQACMAQFTGGDNAIDTHRLVVGTAI